MPFQSFLSLIPIRANCDFFIVASEFDAKNNKRKNEIFLLIHLLLKRSLKTFHNAD